MKINEVFKNDDSWNKIGTFGNCYIYSKNEKRILVNINTNIIVFIYE